MMESYTPKQRFQIVKAYYQNSESIANTLRALTPIFGCYNRPSRSTIERLVEKFESVYTLHNIVPSVRHRNARSDENIADVQRLVAEDPNQSIRRRSQQLGISQASVWRILRKDLYLHPYKIVLTQELKLLDHRQRREFTRWSFRKMNVDPQFHRKIIFSDEAHFWLSGYPVC